MEKDELGLAKQAFAKVVEDWRRDVEQAEQTMQAIELRLKSAKRVYKKTFNEWQRISVIGVEYMGLTRDYVAKTIGTYHGKVSKWVAEYREHGYTKEIS